MYILNAAKTTLHNTDFFQRVVLTKKDDGWLVQAAISGSEPLWKLGRYDTEQQAEDAMIQLAAAMIREDRYFEMPSGADVRERPL